MKMPIDCPFCKDPLLNDYFDGDHILHKTCSRRVDHNIKFGSSYYKSKFDLVSFISTDLHNIGLRAIWYPDVPAFLFNKMNTGGDFRMIYFVPDLTNYPKLIKKLKTYITFS